MDTVEFPLVVGVDGSESSLEALDWAVDSAALHRTALRIVCATPWGRSAPYGASFRTVRTGGRTHVENTAATAMERALRRTGSVRVTSEVTAEQAATALCRRSGTAVAVVVGCRGRGAVAGRLLGSVSLSVATHAQAPVAVVRGPEKNRAGTFHNVVLGIDRPGRTAPVTLAFQEAQLRGSVLTVVHAWSCPAQKYAVQPRTTGEGHRHRAYGLLGEAIRDAAFAHPDVALAREIAEGDPRRALVDASRSADLVVVGARRTTGTPYPRLGPVAHALVHHAQCPVVLVPHA
ncbi:universal stress protein [Streptomyces sp. NPDC050504]|uniref:universal stress protein n=1 Tax=Streptomyces sp. NPDC050504 TaxID=3365618 RepID=UPI0037A19C8A